MKIQVYLENETEISFPFPIEEIAESVIAAVLKAENCPYDTEVNVLLTDNAGIREYNRQMRDIDAPTDVLSFPNLDFETPGVFHIEKGMEADYQNPENGFLILGDIILNVDRIISQAQEYGHSQKREYAFLVAHSMYHLCGYDHMTEEEAGLMECRQEEILSILQITRDADGRV